MRSRALQAIQADLSSAITLANYLCTITGLAEYNEMDFRALAADPTAEYSTFDARTRLLVEKIATSLLYVEELSSFIEGMHATPIYRRAQTLVSGFIDGLGTDSLERCLAGYATLVRIFDTHMIHCLSIRTPEADNVINAEQRVKPLLLTRLIRKALSLVTGDARLLLRTTVRASTDLTHLPVHPTSPPEHMSIEALRVTGEIVDLDDSGISDEYEFTSPSKSNEVQKRVPSTKAPTSAKKHSNELATLALSGIPDKSTSSAAYTDVPTIATALSGDRGIMNVAAFIPPARGPLRTTPRALPLSSNPSLLSNENSNACSGERAHQGSGSSSIMSRPEELSAQLSAEPPEHKRDRPEDVSEPSMDEERDKSREVFLLLRKTNAFITDLLYQVSELSSANPLRSAIHRGLQDISREIADRVEEQVSSIKDLSSRLAEEAATSTIDDLGGELALAHGKVAELQDRLFEAERAAADSERRSEARVKHLQTQVDNFESANSILRSTIAEQEEAITNLKHQVNTTGSVRHTEASDAQRLQGELAAATEELAALKAACKAEHGRAAAELAVQREASSASANQLEGLRQALRAKEEDHGKVSAALAEVQARHGEACACLKAKDVQIRAFKVEVEGLRTQVREAADRQAAAVEQQEALAREHADLRARALQAESRSQKDTELSDRVAALTQEVVARDATVSSLLRDKASLQRDIDVLNGLAANRDAEAALLRETVDQLRADLQHAEARGAESARLLEALQSEAKGMQLRMSELAQSAADGQKEAAAASTRLAAENLALKERANDAAAQLTDQRATILSLRQETDRLRRVVGGRADAAGPGRRAHDGAISRLTLEGNDLKRRLDAAFARNQQLAAENAELLLANQALMSNNIVRGVTFGTNEEFVGDVEAEVSRFTGNIRNMLHN